MNIKASLRSWHTTIIGVAVIAAVVILALLEVSAESIVLIIGALAGIGLIASKDGDKSSEAVGLTNRTRPFAWMAALLIPAAIVGCGTQQRTGFDQITSKATPANQLITDGKTLAASSLVGEPNYTVLHGGPDGGPSYETVQELSTTNLALMLPKDLGQLIYSSPKTLDLGDLVITQPDGFDISLGSFSAGTEAPYTAKADWITEMAEVAKLMSADQREQFLAAVSAVDSIAAAAIQALIPAP